MEDVFFVIIILVFLIIAVIYINGCNNLFKEESYE